jgi:hypothetical protein
VLLRVRLDGEGHPKKFIPGKTLLLQSKEEEEQ